MVGARVSNVLTRKELRSLIEVLPRVHLAACLPTPLEDCPRLSATLGGPRILIKRDDLTGLAFGGNKTRQLEFIMGDALAKGADVVVTGAAAQSNTCRQAAAAARKLGMEAVLVLMKGAKSHELQGNLLLDVLLGAEIKLVDCDDPYELAALLEREADRLRREGRKPYTIYTPTVSASLAAAAYVDCLLELCEQLDEIGASADSVFLAATTATQAGLVLGAKAIGVDFQIVGVTPQRWKEKRSCHLARIANDTAQLLGIGLAFRPDHFTNYEDYVGMGYEVITKECFEAIALVSETEGILLDPIYGGRAMAGLIDQIRKGRIGQTDTVVFLHTGGTPALFAYGEELKSYLGITWPS